MNFKGGKECVQLVDFFFFFQLCILGVLFVEEK